MVEIALSLGAPFCVLKAGTRGGSGGGKGGGSGGGSGGSGGSATGRWWRLCAGGGVGGGVGGGAGSDKSTEESGGAADRSDEGGFQGTVAERAPTPGGLA